MNDSPLILPRLPDNLEGLHKEEERIRTDALLAINANSALKDHMNMIHASMNVIYTFTHEYQKRTDDELTIQLLGIRLFNSSASALALMLVGYYQNSVALLRDLLETGFLMDYFSIDRSKIQEWQRSNEQERKNKFGPVEIRKALDGRDNATEQKRAQIYKLMCTHGTHPTYNGFQLVAPNGLGKVGPFFNENFLRGLIEELVKRVGHLALVYVEHFENAPADFLKVKLDFMNTLEPWVEKYLGTALSTHTARGKTK
jgi:hypothetical protein